MRGAAPHRLPSARTLIVRVPNEGWPPDGQTKTASADIELAGLNSCDECVPLPLLENQHEATATILGVTDADPVRS